MTFDACEPLASGDELDAVCAGMHADIQRASGGRGKVAARELARDQRWRVDHLVQVWKVAVEWEVPMLCAALVKLIAFERLARTEARA